MNYETWNLTLRGWKDVFADPVTTVFCCFGIFGKVTSKKILSPALCAPGHHTATSRRKCITQSTFLTTTTPNIHRYLSLFYCSFSNKHISIWLLTIPPHLKYVTTVPCNLSLISASVCNCRLFSDISVSRGSVATHMRCGEIVNKFLAAYLLENLTVKKTIENPLRINRVTAMSLVSPFFGTRCTLLSNGEKVTRQDNDVVRRHLDTHPCSARNILACVVFSRELQIGWCWERGRDAVRMGWRGRGEVGH